LDSLSWNCIEKKLDKFAETGSEIKDIQRILRDSTVESYAAADLLELMAPVLS
jgi:hypothetical protein